MIVALLWACRAEVTPLPDRAATVIQPATRDPGRWATARCNDGTPFAYTYRPGRSDTWVVNVAGGHFCDDVRNPCSQRRPRLRTTLAGADGDPAPMKTEGIFSMDPAENPDFADAHHVDAHYCSSDLWFGDTADRIPTTGDPQGWHFSGRHNLRALLASLPVTTPFDPATARVLLLGTSAGGAGVVGNLPHVAEAWAPLVRDGRLKVVLDGSWVADLPEGSPDPDHWGKILPPCDDARVAQGEDPDRCIVGPVWWPYAEATGIPILVQISQLDTTHAAAFGIDTPEEEAAWAARVRASLEGVPWVWTAERRYHVLAIDPAFSRATAEDNFRDVVGRFWRGGQPERVFRGP